MREEIEKIIMPILFLYEIKGFYYDIQKNTLTKLKEEKSQSRISRTILSVCKKGDHN